MVQEGQGCSIFKDIWYKLIFWEGWGGGEVQHKKKLMHHSCWAVCLTVHLAWIISVEKLNSTCACMGHLCYVVTQPSVSSIFFKIYQIYNQLIKPAMRAYNQVDRAVCSVLVLSGFRFSWCSLMNNKINLTAICMAVRCCKTKSEALDQPHITQPYSSKIVPLCARSLVLVLRTILVVCVKH